MGRLPWEEATGHIQGDFQRKPIPLALAFWRAYSSWINFKGITEQAQKCTQSLDVYPDCLKPSSWPSHLSRAAISIHLNIPFSGLVPAYGWLFRTFALFFFFWPDTEVCPWPNNANRQAPESAKCLPILLLEPGESVLFSSLTSNSQLTLVLTENIKKQIHHRRIEVAARFWTVGEDRC